MRGLRIQGVLASALATGAALVFLLAWGWSIRVDRIEHMLPYCQHPDEHVWVSKALGMVRTGNLNPQRFTKPSLMVYLNAAGLGLTSLLSDDPALAPARLPNSCYPYFERAELIRPLRQVYAAISLCAIALAALTARKLAQRSWGGAGIRADAAALLTAALALGSPFYLRLSTWYLNVDVLGCLTALAVIACSVTQADRWPPRAFALVSGGLAGLCVGTKYNLFPILAPPLLGLWLFQPRRWLDFLAFAVAAGLAFVLTTPFALLRPQAFVQGLVHEAVHYATGAGSPTREPGLEMFLAYGGTVLGSFGWGVLALAALGLGALFRRDWRWATVALSYPILLWLYMSLQRTFFARNLLVLELVIPLLAAFGALGIVDFVGTRAHAWQPRLPRVFAPAVVLPLLVGLGALTWPTAASRAAFVAHPESRNQAVDWILENAPKGSTILLARELNLDARRLQSAFRVVVFESSKESFTQRGRRHGAALAILPVIDDRRLRREVKPGRVLLRAGRNALRARDLPRKTRQKSLSGDPRLLVVRL